MNRSRGLPSDFNEWELSKENVQPIKQGRKIPNLNAALAPNSDDAHWQLQKDKQRFEAEIRTYNGEDCLDVWYRYILWTEENVPKGGREISTLLERCIKEFKDDEKYKCDERYLRVWLKYADCCEDALEIFSYMYSQGISATLPRFYIAWSSACENVQNFKKADQVLVLGIERNVQPSEVLKKYHLGFQRRLSNFIEDDEEARSCESPENSRTALASLKTSGKKKLVGVMRTPRMHNSLVQGNAFGPRGNISSAGSSFSVMHEPNNENNLSGIPRARGDWKEPPAQSISTKENVNLPGKWTKEKPSSRSNHAVPLVRPVAKQNFLVHVEESAEQNAPRQNIANQVLTTRKLDEAGPSNPLKAIGKHESTSGGQVKFKLMYDKDKVYCGTEEFQFEEIRAAKYAELLKQGRPLPKEVNRLRREREGLKSNAQAVCERFFYQKEKVYAFEGEFQPEEIMARLYYERGGCLRRKKIPGNQRTTINDKSCENIKQKENEDLSIDSYAARTDTAFSSSLGFNRNVTENRNPKEFLTEENPEVIQEKNWEIDPRDQHRTKETSRVRNISDLEAQREVLVRLNVHSALSHTPENKSFSNLTPGLSSDTKALGRNYLTGPSPTLTTKQAYAEVMPWFNTTVGLNNSEDDSDADFKNNPHTENNLDLIGIAFGGEFNVAQDKHERNSVDDFRDGDEENVPPAGYTQPKIDRPTAGILQPSIGVPVQPLYEEQSSDEEDAARLDDSLTKERGNCDGVFSEACPSLRYEQVKDHCDTNELTNFQGLNHSQFTAAARLASTPFEDRADPTALPTLHCSSIKLCDVVVAEDNEGGLPNVSESDAQSTGIPSSSFNTPSKVLSPILECSDEYAKTSSSGASSHSSGNSTRSGKSTTVSQCTDRHETFLDHDASEPTCDARERSLDITVHNAEGQVLKVVNPFDPAICRDLLSQLSEPVDSYRGYHNLKEKMMTKICAKKAVDIGDDVYKIDKCAGSGGFANVFSASKVDFQNFGDEDEETRPKTLALKVQNPANEWEFYVCSELQRRLKLRGNSTEECSRVVKVEDFYVFADGSCLVTEFHEKGTFLDMVNCYKTTPGFTIGEFIAMHYAIEMMKILECIHACGIIHGDIKPDNLVLIGSNDSQDVKDCGLALIDFGRAIDVTLFPAGTRFSVNKNTEAFECIEMKAGRPWTTQVDTYGMLGCLYCLIFGDYMKVYQDSKNSRWRPLKLVKRCWNRQLWMKLFDVFLNIPSCDELPSITAMRQEFQEYFSRQPKAKDMFSVHRNMLEVYLNK